MSADQRTIEDIYRRLARLEDRVTRNQTVGQPFKSVVADYMFLPHLRGFWPLVSRNESDNVLDYSGQGRTLTNVSCDLTELGNNNMWYAECDGTNDYMHRADEAGTSITGNMTVGGWVWRDTDATFERLGSKFNATGNQRTWALFQNSSKWNFTVSSNGTATTAVNGSASSSATGRWEFVVGRYTTSTEIAVFCMSDDGQDKATNTTSIPASIFDSTTSLVFAANGDAAFGNKLDGRLALLFLCATAVSDSTLYNLYFRTLPLFQVFT